MKRAKKLLALFMALLLCFCLLPSAFAEGTDGDEGLIRIVETPAEQEDAGIVAGDPVSNENYELQINGRRVTSDNASDVFGDGVFSYDNETKTLTVNGSFTGTGGTLINNSIEGLTIYTAKDATLDADGSTVIMTYKDLTITGPGKLSLVGAYGLYEASKLTVTIKNACLDIAAEDYAVTGNWYGEKLAIEFSYVHATVEEDRNAVGCSGGITLTRCCIVEPEGGKIDNNGRYIVQADGKKAPTVTIVPDLNNPFVDVKEGKYYYDPVLWAYYHDPQITSGVDETHFGPGNPCTREQIVTFLWKACGAPEPETTENPFSDVKSGKYYYKAVLWAVENEITSGVGEGKFGVNQPCTREQSMTFLWKACGAPEPASTDNPFTDVKASKYYFKPVMWAVENGITSGVSADQFGVGQTCTRGQIVTFLNKAMGN